LSLNFGKLSKASHPCYSLSYLKAISHFFFNEATKKFLYKKQKDSFPIFVEVEFATSRCYSHNRFISLLEKKLLVIFYSFSTNKSYLATLSPSFL